MTVEQSLYALSLTSVAMHMQAHSAEQSHAAQLGSQCCLWSPASSERSVRIPAWSSCVSSTICHLGSSLVPLLNRPLPHRLTSLRMHGWNCSARQAQHGHDADWCEAHMHMHLLQYGTLFQSKPA